MIDFFKVSTAFVCVWSIYQASATDIYRSVDDSGKVVFSSQPSPSAKKMEIKTPAMNTDELVSERENRLKNISNANAADREIQKGERRKQLDMHRKKCSELQSHIQHQSQAGAFYYKNTNGERTYISDKEIKSRLTQLRKKWDEECKDI